MINKRLTIIDHKATIRLDAVNMGSLVDEICQRIVKKGQRDAKGD
ncbi:MAG: hypothetical protein ABSA82_08875 [Thermacetogeniaceae bacterium]|jgi:hypothetical protein